MESDDGEYEVLDSTLPSSHITTVNVSGGVGGAGGRGGQGGGAGGNGEGPHLYFKSAIVNVQHHFDDSSNQDSLVDSNFRRIPWGDVFLQRQLYVDSPGSYRASYRARFSRKRSSVRIVRSAKIDSREFTVATYEGEDAEKEWKEDIETFMDIRHENVLQLYGTVRWRNIWAAVFHGAELTRFVDFVSDCWYSPILICYIYGHVSHIHDSVDSYLRSNFGREMARFNLLINRSNGRLCIDLDSGHKVALDCYMARVMRVPYWNLAEPLSPMEMASPTKFSYIVETLTLDQYHEITCAWFRSASMYRLSSFTDTLHLGGLYYAADDSSLQLVALRQLQSDDEISSLLYSLSPEPYLSYDYGPASVKIPERPWYWSLDPYGAEKLNEEKATELGFPTIEPDITICARKWDEFVYDGLSQFHERKGFDPYSQEVAVKLNEPLFEILSDQEPLIVEIYVPDEQRECSSDPDGENSEPDEEGHAMTGLSEAINMADITPKSNIESTSFNETGESTGQASPSASFIPPLGSVICSSPHRPDDTGLEEFLTMLPSQIGSAIWDNQNWSFDLFDEPLPQANLEMEVLPIRGNAAQVPTFL
ncbi:hypothetical protein R3P38DRAFT_3257674 [Favolaschia claudopus]|uniref:Protein kinase domain-containing protein n=1 Tax=Favolaschia claudopus TaxID=2862362 RepID=A0AAW0D316_9AGAR